MEILYFKPFFKKQNMIQQIILPMRSSGLRVYFDTSLSVNSVSYGACVDFCMGDRLVICLLICRAHGLRIHLQKSLGWVWSQPEMMAMNMI